jgi:hypothetical protein
MAIKLRIDPAFEPSDAFICIATTMPVIQLVHFINSQTWLKLVREDDLPVYSEKTDSLRTYKFFHCMDEDFRSTFSLLSNNNEGLYVLPSHKQFGFFLVIYGAIPADKIKQLIAQIKSISGVQLAASISQEPGKVFGPILQDLELHLTDLKRVKAGNEKRFMPPAEEQ